MPQAYEPIPGQRFQILTRYRSQAWEHCDYAEDAEEKAHLLREYRLAYGPQFAFKTILLPSKYWPKIEGSR